MAKKKKRKGKPVAKRPAGLLSPKQARFVEEYLIDLNGTQAAIRAGYSPKSAGRIQNQLLAKKQVSEAVAQRRKKLAEKAEVTQEKIVTELAKLGFSNMLDYIRVQPDGSAVVDLASLTREQAAALSEVVVDEYMDGGGEDARPVKKVKVKLADKRNALVDLGKHLGMFVEKVELSGKAEVHLYMPDNGRKGDS